MNIRRLVAEDYHKGYLELLSQLTTVSEISFEQFSEQLKRMSEHVYVMESGQKIIGTGTLLLEAKIIHQCGWVGHIEDIVIDQDHRGQHLGAQMIKYLV